MEEAKQDDYQPLSEIPIAEFWKLMGDLTVRELEEMMTKLSFESNVMSEAFARNFQAINEIGKAGKIDFVENKELHILFQQSLGAYGYQVRIRERMDVIKHWMHEKMPDCFKQNKQNVN